VSGEINYRAASPEDREGIWRVHTAAIRETCSSHYPPEQIEAWAGLLSASSSYDQALAEHEMLVAVDAGGQVVGFGQLDVLRSEIEAIYVDPAASGRGVGRALLAQLEQLARERGLQALQLAATLNAVTFYEAAGYRRGQDAVHRLPDGRELPCIEMTRRL
jgi:putative acetyltransferase